MPGALRGFVRYFDTTPVAEWAQTGSTFAAVPVAERLKLEQLERVLLFARDRSCHSDDLGPRSGNRDETTTPL